VKRVGPKIRLKPFVRPPIRYCKVCLPFPHASGLPTGSTAQRGEEFASDALEGVELGTLRPAQDELTDPELAIAPHEILECVQRGQRLVLGEADQEGTGQFPRRTATLRAVLVELRVPLAGNRERLLGR
jgi:hypothetical protein